MNIHINEELNKEIESEVIFEREFGSSLYGLEVSTSDTDILRIYVERNDSLLWEHHQLQYKEAGVDYVYTSLDLFIRNLITSDSTINFEVLFTKEFEESELNWLCKYREDFINYNVIKSYLGFAKRDLKNYRSKENSKKLYHFLRGIMFVDNLLDFEFDVKLESDENKDNLKLLKEVRNGKTVDVNEWEKKMDLYRLQLKDILKEGYINKIMNPLRLKELDNDYKNYMKSKSLKEINYGDIYYNVLEKGISY